MKTTEEWIELIEGHEDIKLTLLAELRDKRVGGTESKLRGSLFSALATSFLWDNFEKVYKFKLDHFAERVRKGEIKLKSEVTVKEFSHYNI